MEDCFTSTHLFVTRLAVIWRLSLQAYCPARLWRFNELQKSIDGISQKALTELGESMRPIIKSAENWGKTYKGQAQET